MLKPGVPVLRSWRKKALAGTGEGRAGGVRETVS
jgi:hypothetical protein